MQRTRLLALAGCLAMVASCESSTDVSGNVSYAGVLNGTKEKPTATTSAATGQILVTVNPSNTMSYSVTWTGLTGAVTGAHIHGPADENTAAGVLVDFQALPTGSANQAITLTAAGAASGNVNLNLAVNASVSGDSLKKLLNAGLLYVNVHTAANAGGEIRSQIIKQ